MSKEFGFIHLPASILAGDLLDEQVEASTFYAEEKERVKKLMMARMDIDDVNSRSRLVVAKLIKKELNNWWKESLYNMQVDAKMTEIIDFVSSQVKSLGHSIIFKGRCNIIIDDISDVDCRKIKDSVIAKWNGLLIYSENIADINTARVPKY
jgi:KaiC/GvpD/RAD55 family RecA-like ATPase